MMKKNGRIPFRAVGQAVALGHTDGHDLRVTVGVGARCSQSMVQMRAKGRRMVLP
jgi:bacterioferritin-associated ferredoxin